MARCYVGTYGKYNGGSLAGGWLDLSDYATYQDFLKACKELHKNESDPEFMIQDWESLPDGFPAQEWISKDEFNEIKLSEAREQTADLRIIDYSDKCIAVVGETRAIKDKLAKMGGRFNSRLTCGAGWVFPKTKLDLVQGFIKGNQILLGVEPKQQKDEALWEEFKQRVSKAEGGRQNCIDNHLKEASEIMMTDCGVILVFEKPHVNAGTFWFHDEGPNYEYYQKVTATDKTKIEYFMRENLDEYDSLIKEMTERKNRYGDPLVPVFYEHEWCSVGLLGWGNSIYMKREHDVQEDEQDPRTRKQIHRMTESDTKKALAILKSERAKFEKRLQAYLKRYGVGKISFGTYWADR